MSTLKSWFKHLLENFKQVFVRYSLACLFSLAITVMISSLIIAEDIKMEAVFFSVMWGCGLAAVLTFAFGLFCKHHETQWWQQLIGYGAAVLLAAGGGWLFFHFYGIDVVGYYATTMVFITLLVLFWLPMAGKRNIQLTWNYHARLVLSGIAAVVLGCVVALSLSGILGSINLLFGVKVEKLLEILLAITYCFFTPCCAMALMPVEREAYDQPLQYHKFTRILALYILLPLICIEGIILYIYMFKILFQWQLPEGGVAYLVFSYAIIGSLIWYLLMPVYLSEDKQWARFFNRTFFISLLPLLGLLFVGLFRRIGDYGLTTNRYIVFLVACWFTVMAIFMAIKNTKNVLPWLMSLTAISLLVMFGPWSMFAVPKVMQTRHFEKITTEYNLLVDSHIVAPAESLTLEQNIELSESLDFFLEEQNRYEFTEHYFGLSKDGTDSLDDGGYYALHNRLMERMKGEYIHEWDRRHREDAEVVEVVDETYSFRQHVDTKQMYHISGYDYSFYLDEWNNGLKEHWYENDPIRLNVKTNLDSSAVITFSFTDHSFDINPIESLGLAKRIDNGCDNYGNLLHNHEIVHEDSYLKLYLDVLDIRVLRDSTGTDYLDNIEFRAFLKKK